MIQSQQEETARNKDLKPIPPTAGKTLAHRQEVGVMARNNKKYARNACNERLIGGPETTRPGRENHEALQSRRC